MAEGSLVNVFSVNLNLKGITKSYANSTLTVSQGGVG